MRSSCGRGGAKITRSGSRIFMGWIIGVARGCVWCEDTAHSLMILVILSSPRLPSKELYTTDGPVV